MSGAFRIRHGVMVDIVGCDTKAQEAALMEVARATGEIYLTVNDHHQQPFDLGSPYVRVMGRRGKQAVVVGYLPITQIAERNRPGWWEPAGKFRATVPRD